MGFFIIYKTELIFLLFYKYCTLFYEWYKKRHRLGDGASGIDDDK